MPSKASARRRENRAKAVTAEARTEVRLVEVECPVDKKTAAGILGIAVDTLDTWTVEHGIPHIKYDFDCNTGNRGKVVYFVSDLLAFRERYRVERGSVAEEVDKILSEV